MEIPYALFPASWHWLSVALSAVVFHRLARTAPWKRLASPAQLHLLAGFVVGLMLLWTVKAGVRPGLNLHLLGAAAATLALGPRLAIVALGLALVAVTANGAIEWRAWPLNFLLMAVVPVAVAQTWMRAVERRLPPHLFVFIFVAAFLGSAVTVAVQGGLAAAALAASGAYLPSLLATEYLPYLLLLAFAEAWMSGAAITLLVVYRPEWVAAFDERRYLTNK